jgi:predicted DCC family thiol-disulfide oxidoreductase YuxK
VTGGTYSVFRAAYGAFLAAVFISEAMATTDQTMLAVAIVGLLCTVPFIIGWKDRWAAGVIATTILASGIDGDIVVPLLTIAPLAVHLGLGKSPYGSLDAAGRPDPGGGFSLPESVGFVVYALLAGAYVALALPVVRAPSPTLTDWSFGACAGLYLVLGIAQKSRFMGWVIMLGALVGRLVVVEDPVLVPLLFIHFLAFDQSGIPARADVRGERVFYDGACGLCHRAVRFVLAEDRTGKAFRFAPLGGDAFEAEVPDDSKDALPDSIVLVTGEGEVLVRSHAILRMMGGLGGLWRVLGIALAVIPGPLRDLAYDGIAAVRHRVFKKPADVCPIIPSHLRSRFDL